MIELSPRSLKLSVRTRAQRRAAIVFIIRQLLLLREAENRCLDNTPGNLMMSDNYSIGKCAVECIDIALDFLSDIYPLHKKEPVDMKRNLPSVPF